MIRWKLIEKEIEILFDYKKINLCVIKDELELNGFKELGKGNTRIAFLSPRKNFVIKIPINQCGINDNCRENFRYNQKRKVWYPLARSRLMRNKLILVMEYIDTRPLGDYPDWCDFVDCRQVGYNSKGKLVAYDYGQ